MNKSQKNILFCGFMFVLTHSVLGGFNEEGGSLEAPLNR